MVIEGLICPLVAIYLFLERGAPDWNNRDIEAIHIAETRCAVKFPQSPCLKKFSKTGVQEYVAICGKNAK